MPGLEGPSLAALSSAELFDPKTSTWTSTGPMSSRRTQHTATLLPSGRVLVVGGVDDLASSSALATAEIYDPATERWTSAGDLMVPRRSHTATLLLDGRVLAAGGADRDGTNSSAELYDDKDDRWFATGDMTSQRSHHTAIRLADGIVLAAGGRQNVFDALDTAELFDPDRGTWAATPRMSTGRSEATTVLLADGRVLLLGGNETGFVTFLASSEIFAP
jgi:N-acetylneuraminic acid mutarotase